MATRVFYIILFILYFTKSYGQSTYTKLVDLGISNSNITIDAEIIDSFSFIASKHFCSNANDITSCSVITKFNKTEIIDQIIFENFDFSDIDCLLISNDSIFISGMSNDSDFTSETLILNENLYLLDTIKIHEDESNGKKLVHGIVKKGSNLIEFSSQLSNDSKVSGIINYIDLNTKSLDWKYIFNTGKKTNKINNLTFGADDSIVINVYRNDNTGQGSNDSYNLYLIDDNGKFLDSLSYEDILIDPVSIFVDKEGSIFFNSENNPLNQIIPSNGRINKSTLSLNDIDWSLELPSDPFTNSRKYKVRSIDESHLNSLLISGLVWDEEEDGPISNSQNHVWNGSFLEVNKNGSIVFNKVYKHLNDISDSQSLELNGRFLNSSISKIIPTNNNQYLVVGTVYYSQKQIVSLDSTETTSYLWLMEVDSQGNVYPSTTQNEVVEINHKYSEENLTITENNIWNVSISDISGEIQYLYSFDSTPVIINETEYLELEYKLNHSNSGWIKTGDLLREENNIVYLLKDTVEYLIYNFNLNKNDTISINTNEGNLVDLIVENIDTIELLNNANRKAFTLFCEENPNHKTTWIEGIGDLTGIIGILQACQIDQSGNLVCFETLGETLFINDLFPNCNITAIEEQPTLNNIAIFPNPAQDKVWIKPLDILVDLSLITTEGKLVLSKSNTNQLDVRSIERGLYFLLVKENGNVYIEKLIIH